MSRLGIFKRSIGRATLIALLALPGTARAQASASDKAAAEALFDRGLNLMRRNEFQEACQVLEQSQAIERGLGTMLYLAECYEKLGRTASAWALFREAASEARAAGQTARAEQGASRAAALEPKLSKLAVQVAPGNLIPGFELFRDGQPVGSGMFGVAVPVDPGEHQLEARAPGRQPWTSIERVGADGDSVVVNVPELLADPTAAAATAKPESTPLVTTGETTPGDEPRPASSQRTVGLVLGAAGVVSLGVGAFFGARAISKHGDAEDICPGSSCPTAQGERLNEQAKDAATLANVFVIGGAAVAATGLVLYLTAPSSEATTASVSTDGTGLRLNVGGVF
jgi:serine/threonine-protein kinase